MVTAANGIGVGAACITASARHTARLAALAKASVWTFGGELMESVSEGKGSPGRASGTVAAMKSTSNATARIAAWITAVDLTVNVILHSYLGFPANL